MIRPILALAVALGAATPLFAQAMSGKDAKQALFATAKAEVEIMPEAGLPADQAEILKTVGVGQAYYGAIAMAPDEGLMSEATVAAANFHDAASAAAAALADCNAKKKSATDCVIAAYIRPEGWKEPGLSLSSDATAAFKDYDMKSGALAVSPTTGAFGLGKGKAAEDDALKACAAMNEKATDCAVAIRN